MIKNGKSAKVIFCRDAKVKKDKEPTYYSLREKGVSNIIVSDADLVEDKVKNAVYNHIEVKEPVMIKNESIHLNYASFQQGKSGLTLDGLFDRRK